MVPYVHLSTNYRIGCQYSENKICTVIKLSSPQLVGNCTYGIIAFSCIKSSLGQGAHLNNVTQVGGRGVSTFVTLCVNMSEQQRQNSTVITSFYMDKGGTWWYCKTPFGVTFVYCPQNDVTMVLILPEFLQQKIHVHSTQDFIISSAQKATLIYSTNFQLFMSGL